MYYISTRDAGGMKSRVGASAAILSGIAPDGGLYVPTEIPRFYSDDITRMNYKELAREILSLFFTDYTDDELAGCVNGAYGEGFDDLDIAPLERVGDVWFLELFHGKTQAFKDIALSILPRLMTIAAKKQNNGEKAKPETVILTATSGDTGGAALSGFAGVHGTRAIVFYPYGGVSEIQRLQMVSRGKQNVFVAAVRGNFDDAQRGVKNIFADAAFADTLRGKGFALSSANSINIGRLVPQIVYYYYAYAKLLKSNDIKPGEKADFAVPTGNFGDILAGYYAYKMGLPVGRLICASNINNVLYDFFTTGVYDANRQFILTSSPAMDILVSSNLERLLYDLCGGDGVYIKSLMTGLSETGRYKFDFIDKNEIIVPAYASEEKAAAAIKSVFETSRYVIDTHTAVAYAALKKVGGAKNATVVVSTASPYKFAPDVYAAITGEKSDGLKAIGDLERLSGVKAPAALAALKTKRAVHNEVINLDDMKGFVEKCLS